MKTQSKWLGIIVMVTVIGFSFVACKDGGGGGSTSKGGDTNYLDTVNLNNGSPTNAALAASGLTQSQFNQIRDAADGGFQGWAIEDGDLVMVWTGRSLSDFNSVAGVLDTLFGEEDRGNESGLYGAFGDNYELDFFSTKYSEDGIFLPAGSMVLFIYQ